MKKTLDDYMKDPGIANEPIALREIHAIRLRIYEEIKDMTEEERTAYFHERAQSAFSRMGMTAPYTNF